MAALVPGVRGVASRSPRQGWEMAIKSARGRLADIRTGGHATLAAMLSAHGFDLLPLDAGTAEQAAHLPPLHGEALSTAPCRWRR